MKIAIASGKGGVGKTSLATNLCALMAEYQDIVLVDMDVEEPDAALFLPIDNAKSEVCYKLIPDWDRKKCSLCGKCQEVCNFNAIILLMDEIIIFPELCHSCHACAELCPDGALSMKGQPMGTTRSGSIGKMTVIENRLDIGQEQAVPMIVQSLAYLEKHHRHSDIILDSPPGTSCPVIEIAQNVDLLILVAEPTPFGLNDLRLSVETMKLIGCNYVVVINRSGIGNSDVEDYCIENSIPVIAKIPNFRQAAKLYSSGKLMYDSIPEVREQLEKVREYILSQK